MERFKSNVDHLWLRSVNCQTAFSRLSSIPSYMKRVRRCQALSDTDRMSDGKPDVVPVSKLEPPNYFVSDSRSLPMDLGKTAELPGRCWMEAVLLQRRRIGSAHTPFNVSDIRVE